MDGNRISRKGDLKACIPNKVMFKVGDLGFRVQGLGCFGVTVERSIPNHLISRDGIDTGQRQKS